MKKPNNKPVSDFVVLIRVLVLTGWLATGPAINAATCSVHAEPIAEATSSLFCFQTEARSVLHDSNLLFAGGIGLLAVVGLLAAVSIRTDTRPAAEVERDLQKSRVLLDSILDHAPALMWLSDAEGRFLFVNRRFEQVTGRTRSEVEGKTYAEVWPGEFATLMHSHQRQALESPSSSEVEIQIPVASGNQTHWCVSFPVRDEQGKIYATATIATDISERKKAEEERDRFFTLSLDLLCVAHADGTMKWMNSAITKMLGWQPEEVVAKPFLQLVHPDDHAAVMEGVEQQVRHGQPVVHFEVRFRHKDGSWRVLSWNSMPYGDLMYAVGRDVTEQKQDNERIAQLHVALQRRAALLEASNKELEAFSYSVSHDLRAPLRHIDGFVDLLRKTNEARLDDQGRRYLKIIADSAKRMGVLIDDLLVFSRMGRADLRYQPVDTAALVQETIRLQQQEAANRQISWQIGTLPQVVADLGMLKQVWANLIGNAVKFTRPRTPALIEIGCDSSRADEHKFFVRDNGVGFDMTYVEKLFGVFQRLHRVEEFEGTGIGLANVRRIILRHGGRTWAEGKVDGGATFYFTLPKAHAV